MWNVKPYTPTNLYNYKVYQNNKEQSAYTAKDSIPKGHIWGNTVGIYDIQGRGLYYPSVSEYDKLKF